MTDTMVAFGEIMLRLTPSNGGTIQTTANFDACYGGSEANVLACLSSLGNKTQYLTALPTSPVADAAVFHLRALGVGTDYILRSGDTMGMYFLEKGFGARGARVVYNRRYAEITKLTKDSFDYDSVFHSCSVFHISGISFALSPSVQELCFTLLSEAKKRQIPVSFDFNYRSKLWSETEAAEVYRKIIPYVDIVFCSNRDLSTFLGTDTTGFSEKYPTTILVVRDRGICSSGKHKTDARVYIQKNGTATCVASESATFDVLERIGSGDAFAGGFLDQWIRTPLDLSGTLKFAMACFILKHTIPGDTFSLDRASVENYLENISISKDVNR